MVNAAELAAMRVEVVMGRWPQTVIVFHKARMMCVGCACASFCTVSDAARFHGVALEAFLAQLQTAIAAPTNKS